MIRFIYYIGFFLPLTSCVRPEFPLKREKTQYEIQLSDNNVQVLYAFHNDKLSILVLNKGEKAISTYTPPFYPRLFINSRNEKILLVSNEIDESSIEFPLKTVRIIQGDSIHVQCEISDLKNIKKIILSFDYVFFKKGNTDMITNFEYMRNVQRVSVEMKL